MNPCHACELIQRRDAGLAPLWDSLYRTQFWDVVHAFGTALPGWLVIVARRHVQAIDQLSDEEAAELGILIRRASVVLKQVVGCTKTYVAQFADKEGYHHVHFHIIPCMADLPDNRRGPNIFAYMGAPENQPVSEAKMNELAAEIRALLVGMAQ